MECVTYSPPLLPLLSSFTTGATAAAELAIKKQGGDGNGGFTLTWPFPGVSNAPFIPP